MHQHIAASVGSTLCLFPLRIRCAWTSSKGTLVSLTDIDVHMDLARLCVDMVEIYLIAGKGLITERQRKHTRGDVWSQCRIKVKPG